LSFVFYEIIDHPLKLIKPHKLSFMIQRHFIIWEGWSG